MQNQRRIMLFSPPLAPVPMTTEFSVVIGRQSDCDLPLCYSDISRHHAEVTFEGGEYVLRDIGSTNGTFLNSKEITEPMTLSAGDKIELGSRVVTFCELSAESVGVAPSGDQTIIAEHMPTAEAFRGDLSQIPPFAVFQVLQMGSKTGVLKIDAPDNATKIWFSQGAPIHAESSRQTGFDAALKTVTLEQGRFNFAPQPVTIAVTIVCSVTELLMEGCRIFDEENA